MSTKGIVLVLVSAFCAILSNLMMRGGLNRAGGFTLSVNGLTQQLISLLQQPLFVFGAVFYAMATITYLDVISREQLSISYPLLVSVNFFFLTIGSALLLNEPINLHKIAGLGLILAGILTIVNS
jgi:multidrug transporter EmrE-like cation transporter